MEETVITQPTEATPPPAPVAAPETPAAPALPENRRDLIARELKSPTPRQVNGRPRDTAGKFAPSDPAAASPLPDSQFPTPQASSPKPPAMPKSLRLELQPHWEKTPAELQAAINQREADYEKGVLPLKEKARQADELLNELRPYEMLMRAENTTAPKVIGSLLQTAAILRTGSPVQKAYAVAQTMRQFGIPIEHLQQVLSGNAPPQPQHDPQYQQLAQQVQQLTAAQQQQQEKRANSAISKFAADPKHKHFDAVSERMLTLLQNPAVMGQEVGDMSEDEKLTAAYETACRLDPAIHQQMLTEQQQAMIDADRAKTQVAQARNAAVQVKGSPSAGPSAKPNPKDRPEVIRAAIRATR